MADASAGAMTYQSGDPSGGKQGIRGEKARLFAPEYGGGFLGRQVVPPELLAAMQAGALGQTESPATILGRSMLAQQQAQAYGLAAGAQGMSPALAMRQAQQAAGGAGLQAQAQFGAMNADWAAQQQQAWANAMLNQQSLNDAAAAERERILSQLVMANYAGRDQGFDWGALLGAGIGGAATVGAGALMGPLAAV